MLLMSASDAAAAIGAKCGGSAPSADDAQLTMVLGLILPRVEGALNVHSLIRQKFVDHFYLSAMPRYADRPESKLLLSNGFVVPGSVALTTPDGTLYVDEDIPSVQLDEGHISIHRWSRGMYSVAYESGFEVPPIPDEPPAGYNPDNRVLLNVPPFIQALVISLLVVWYRTVFLNPRASKDLSFAAVDQLLRRELYARVYENYMRPRVSVTFSERMDRVA